MIAHAVLSPSSAQRWLSCTPSARFEQEFPDKGNEAADEGTLAHSLGELLISKALGRVTDAFYATQIKQIAANTLFSMSMREYCDDYAAFVLERFAETQAHTKDAVMFLEQKLDLTDYVPEGFGTGDDIIIANSIMDITDFKYGKGVPVSAERNKQMMLYGLGALKEFDFLYDIETVRMTIYQPRIDNISTFEISVEELYEWAEEELKPRAALAFEGLGEFVPGDHCRFCKAKAVCKANARMNLEVAKYEFQNPANLTDKEIADILKRAEVFKNWLTSVEEYALEQAINKGKKWPEFKLVTGRSNRKYADEEDVAVKLKAAGFKEEMIYDIKLKGITAMEELLGKNKFSELLSSYIIKPPGKPTLALLADKRPAYNSIQSAIEDFS